MNNLEAFKTFHKTQFIKLFGSSFVFQEFCSTPKHKQKKEILNHSVIKQTNFFPNSILPFSLSILNFTSNDEAFSFFTKKKEKKHK